MLLEVFRVCDGFSGFLRIFLDFLGFLRDFRVPDGLLRFLRGSLAFLWVPGIVGLNGIQSCFQLGLLRFELFGILKFQKTLKSTLFKIIKIRQ